MGRTDSLFKISYETLYRIKISNYISTALIFVAFPYIFVFYNYSKVLSLTIIPIIGLFALVRLFNARGYFNLARIMLIFSANISATYYAASFGQEAGIHYLLFSYLVVPMVIFRFDEKIKIALGITMPTLCFFYLELTSYFSPTPIYVSDVILNFIRNTSIFFVSLIIILSFLSFINELKTLHSRISRNYSRIKKMILKIRELKSAMEVDLERGRKLQALSLPNYTPFLKGAIISHVAEPARHLSGDYHDFLLDFSSIESKVDLDLLDEEDRNALEVTQLSVVVADVIGKGVPASLEMFSVKTALRLLSEYWFYPEKLITELNRLACRGRLFSKYVPMIFSTLNYISPGKIELRYTNAGHEYGVIVRKDGSLEFLEEGGPGVAMDATDIFAEDKKILLSEDTLFLFTDGCTDLESSSGKHWDCESFYKLLKKAAKHPNKAKLAQFIRNRLHDFKKSAPLADDISIVVISIL